MNEEKNIINRFDDLSRKAEDRGYFTFSDFLNMDEQNILVSHFKKSSYRLYGGYEGAERVVAAFGDYDYDFDAPISIVQIKPVSKKFAKELSHRDFLGSLMGIGIRREIIGDIVINDNNGYVFCLDKISTFIIDNLDKVGSTDVKCSICETLPKEAQKTLLKSEVIVPSLRIDAVLSSVFSLSRSDAAHRIASGKAFINSKEVLSSSHLLKDGDIVSLRGSGRVKIGSVLRMTKKDRLVLSIYIY